MSEATFDRSIIEEALEEERRSRDRAIRPLISRHPAVVAALTVMRVGQLIEDAPTPQTGEDIFGELIDRPVGTEEGASDFEEILDRPA